MATIITKTIGQDGWQDFSGIQQATDAITTSDVANTADLVAADKAVVFEIYAGVYNEGVLINEGLTCDATRNVTYKPAAGSEHGGDFNAGVRVVFNTAGNGCFNIEDDFTHIVGLVCTTDTGAVGNRGLIQANAGGILVEGCILRVEHSTPWCLFSNQGGATAVNVYQNNLLRNANERPIALYSIAAPTSHEFINNTIEGHGDRAIFYQVLGNSMTVEAVNNFIFNVNNWAQGNSSGGSTFTTTGSGNFIDVVGSNMGAGVAAMEGTVTTDTTAPSTGNQAIYTSATGALVNVSGNDAVGVCDGTVAPATDINSEDRIRGAASEYADPGAFTTDKVSITKILDVDGDGDFDNTFDARNAMDDTLHELLGGTRNNLAQRNGEVIYAARRGVYPKQSISWDLNSFDNAITGSGNSFTFKAVDGHEHKGVKDTGPVFPEDGSTTATFGSNIPFAKFQDIQLSRVDDSDGRSNFSIGGSPSGLELERIIFTQDASATTVGHQIRSGMSTGFDGHIYVNNCLFDEKTHYALALNMVNPIPAHFHMSNCTVLDCDRFFGLDNNSVNQPASVTLINNVVPDGQLFGVQYNPPAPFPGSHSNVAALPNSNVLPASAIAGSTGWTFTTSATAPSTGSQVIYDDTTYKLLNVSGNDAVGVGDGTVAPTTDIQGNARIRGAANEYADPGAFSTELITATRTIGKDGWQDFTTFTAAEAEADTIANELLGGSRLNLAERNGKIVYEAYAATYQESTRVQFDDGITAGPGNGVTYQAASGSEHLGVSGEGVYLVRPSDSNNINCFIENDYFTFDGLSVYNQQNNARPITLQGAVNGVTIKNCLVHADISNGICVQTSTRSAGSIAPNVFENNVFRWQGNYGLYLAQAQGSETEPGKAVVNNNTFQASMVGGVCLGFADTGSYLDVSANNNLLLSGLSMYVLGSVRITGQGNFDVQVNQSGPYAPLPENIRGSAAPITVVTETSAISTGSQAVIDADTLALVNVSGNDIVGLGSGSAISVPANDILGNSRIRGASNEYADPGAFSTDLITATKIIDINEGFPYDYSNIKDGFDDQSNTTRSLLGGTRLNLAQRNGNLVYEVRSGRYGLQTTDLPSYWNVGSPSDPLITSPGRSVTIRPEIGSEHNGSFSEGVLLRKTTGNMTYFSAPFMEINGLVIMSPDSGGGYYGPAADGEGVKFKNCLVDWSNTDRDCLKIGISTVEHPIIVENCLLKTDSNFSIRRALVIAPNSHSKIKNCTLIHTLNSWVIGVDNGAEPATTSVELTNCSLISTDGVRLFGNAAFTGSNNICGPTDPLPASTLAEDQTWTFSTSATAPSTGAQLIYDDTTYKLLNVSGNDAVGVGTGTGAPTTDILGNSRIRGADNEYADPGAFTTDLITATKIIDVNFGPGYDYPGFSEAEDDVEEVAHELLGGTRENLAQRNGSIVFEARAGTYPQTNLINDSTITADPSRNVTYKGTGDVTVSSTGTVRNSDDFTVFDGVNINSTVAAYINQGRQAVLKNCTVTAGTHAVGNDSGASLTCDNVITDSNNYSFHATNYTDSTTTLTLRNCTVARAQSAVPIRLQSFNPKGIINASIDNCLLLNTVSQYYDSGDPGTLRLSGGGNVGGAGTPLPSGLRAEGQTWTFSTSATAPSTGNQVIYTSATGALLNVSGNDAIGVGDGTKAPTTDINGNDRIRGLNDEYADPGAFTSEKNTILKRVANLGYGISDNYYDYGSLRDVKENVLDDARDALSDDASRLNLAQRNYELVYEFEKGEYTGADNRDQTINPGGLVFGPTNRLILRANEQSQHEGDFNKGVRIFGTGYGAIVGFYPTSPNGVLFADWEGFVTQIDDAVPAGRITVVTYRNALNAKHCGGRVRNCLDRSTFTSSNQDRAFVAQNDGTIGSSKYPIEIENNVSIRPASCIFTQNSDNEDSKAYIKATNNTFISRWVLGINNYYDRTYPTHFELELNNNILLPASEVDGGHSQNYFIETVTMSATTDFFDGTTILKGANNYSFEGFVYEQAQGNGRNYKSVQIPTYLRGSVYPVNYTTDITSTSADTFIYDADNLSPINTSGNALVGLGDVSLAVSSDIIGVSRLRGADDEYTDPGAFSTSLREIKRTVGSSIRDYDTLNEAKNAAEGLSTNLNLAQRNERIVFEFYDDGVPQYQTVIDTDLISDYDRYVWYRNAPGQDVRITSATYLNMQIKDSFVHWSLGTYNSGSEHRFWLVSDTNNPILQGVLIDNCTFETAAGQGGGGINLRIEGSPGAGNIGTKKYPTVVNNVLFKTRGVLATSYSTTNPVALFLEMYNCTYAGNINGHAGGNVWNFQRNPGVTDDLIKLVNCVNLDGASSDANIGGGNANVQGYGNVGNANSPSPSFKFSAFGIGTDSTSTSAVDAVSTGSLVIYDASTGALVNASGNDFVGAGTGTDVDINVPVTDILGTSRIRGASNEYADPGAFSVDNITYTRTIGLGGSASGFDYGNFTDAEAEVTIIPYAENLAQRNLAIVFEASAGTYLGIWTANSTLTLDPIRTVTYKAAAGSEHGGSSSAGVILDANGNSRVVTAEDDFIRLEGLVFVGGTSYTLWLQGNGIVAHNCIAAPINRGFLAYAGTPTHPILLDNCVSRGGPSYSFLVFSDQDGETDARLTNCVGESTGNDAFRTQLNSAGRSCSAEYINCVGLGTYTHQVIGGAKATGSNNVGGTLNRWPEVTRAEGQIWTFTTDTTASSTGNQVIYTSATGALVNVSGNDAVGVGTTVSVPTTDILGNSRIRGANNEYTDPGAFSTEKVTFTKKIGPYREYTTFTDAEADVVAISTNGNLAERNEAIVFEADAGDYSETFDFNTNGGLTCDPTRNVTWKNGLGSEHGGQFRSGVNILSCYLREDFAVVDGLSVYNPTGGAAGMFNSPKGAFLRNMMVYSPNSYAIRLNGGATAAFPGVVENCVGKSGTSSPFDIRSEESGPAHWRIVNCTAMATGIKQGFRVGISSSDTLNVELVNNVVNGGTSRSYFGFAGPTIALTGSNNVGPDDGSAPFPAAIQAEGQTWTTTTDTTAAPTGNQVVYEAATGKMLAVSGNDAIGIGTLSAAPTTDINGTSRLRGVGTQYVDPGAFTSDVNTITKTIGIGGAASGFDFSDITEAEAALISNSVTYSREYAEKNIAVVFEISPGLYTDNFNVYLTNYGFGPGNSVTFQKAQDEVPVFKITENIYFNVPFGTLDGIEMNSAEIPGQNLLSITNYSENPLGITIKNCSFKMNAFVTGLRPFMSHSGAAEDLGTPEYPLTIANCYFDGQNGIASYTSPTYSGSYYVDVINCAFDYTFGGPGMGQHYGVNLQANDDVTGRGRIFNCIDYTPDADTGIAFNIYAQLEGEYTGNYSVNAFNPNNSASVITATTDVTASSTGNQAIYVSATGALVNVSGNDLIGASEGSAINVPATDILGKSRLRGLSNEYADPGAFTTDIETTTLTANPGTLSSLILNLTPYITTTNIAKRNESIVIELTKADYPHLNFNNNESIIGDSVRNITIKPEEGAHHKGIRGAGIRFISANTGFDTFSLQNVKGFTLEGVELYTPADDIGRYLTVTRFSDAILYKDVILNSVECDGKITTQSWYNNGRLSPLSFRNCLFLTNGGCFTAGTVTAQENQGTYEFTNCTLSGLAASRSIWQFDAVHSGTFNVNLTNNLILSEKRNIGNRWINQTGGFFGDVFVYGRNNFGPDTPNYQLPTAVRGSIYPILPTFDYTPVPASPAAVYRPGTFQLLDIPDNDVLQLGVGTDDPLVPLQGIGEDSRSTSSCNPGCWEDDYELVDLRINTFDGSTGIVDPYFGPPTDIANAVLPDATVPVFIVIGDSTAQGFSVEINDARSYREATDYWPTNAFDGSAYGYFWNKYMTTPDNGVTWTRDISYISPDTSGDAFLPINPRMGGIGVGTFTYSDPLPVSTVPAGNCSPLWDFSLAISGIFRNSAGETLTPHFIFLASTGSRLGSNGPTFLGNDEYNFSPSGYLFNTLNQSYIKPAVDHLMNNGKHPLLVGTLIMAGGTEANISYNPTPDGSKVSTSGAATYVNFLSATEAAAKVSGRAPWIAYEVWDSGSSDYPEVYSKLMQKALYGLKDISITRRINMQNLERDKGTTAQNTDIHFVQYKYPDYGRQFAGAYRALLTWRRSPIFGRTLSEIFNE